MGGAEAAGVVVGMEEVGALWGPGTEDEDEDEDEDPPV